MTIANISGIIFDLGYTLIDYKDTGWPQVRQEALQSGYAKLKAAKIDLPDFDKFVFMYETNKEEFRKAAFESMRGWNIIDVVEELLEEFNCNEPSKYSRIFIETIYNIERKQMIVDDNIINMLDDLKNKKYRIGLISNTIYPAFLHENDLETFGWNKYFDFQIYSSQCTYRKPHPSIFEAGIKEMARPAENIIYVGDRYRMDALGAQKAGLKPVIKYCKKQTYPDQWPKDIPIIQDIADLPNLLDGSGLPI